MILESIVLLPRPEANHDKREMQSGNRGKKMTRLVHYPHMIGRAKDAWEVRGFPNKQKKRKTIKKTE